MFTAITILALAATLTSQPEAAPKTAELVVQVGPVENGDGFVGCLLFASADGFPKEPQKAVAKQRHKAAKTITCTFGNLKPGTYAVSVLHDEDADGELDTNFLGAPSEGYGASNNRLPSMSAPEFDESKVQLGAGEKKKISISLRY